MKNVLIILLIFFTTYVNAQKNSIKEADKLFELKDFLNAVELYKKAYDQEKKVDKKSKILFQTAECYRNINQLSDAEAFYQKSIQKNTQDQWPIFGWVKSICTNTIDVEAKKEAIIEITDVSLTADVDKNIPENRKNNTLKPNGVML
jgi:tetratricopeptide (TPR) repeat protein